MGFTAAGIATDLVTATQQAPLGFELTVPNGNYGNQVWVYIKNVDDGPTALAEGNPVMTLDADDTSRAEYYQVQICPTGRHSAKKVVGVAQHVIAVNSYGFVLKSGKGSVKGGATTDSGLSLMTDTSTPGEVIALDTTGGQNDACIGVSLGDLADDTVGSAIISCGV